MTSGPIADPPPIPMQLMSAIPAGRALGERIAADAGNVQKVSSPQKEPIATKINPK